MDTLIDNQINNSIDIKVALVYSPLHNYQIDYGIQENLLINSNAYTVLRNIKIYTER